MRMILVNGETTVNRVDDRAREATFHILSGNRAPLFSLISAHFRPRFRQFMQNGSLDAAHPHCPAVIFCDASHTHMSSAKKDGQECAHSCPSIKVHSCRQLKHHECRLLALRTIMAAETDANSSTKPVAAKPGN